MAKDEPECEYRDLGIDLWECEGDSDPVYFREEFVGYKRFCSTCRYNREKLFAVGDCRDAYCFGKKLVELTGGEVAFYHRKMKEDASFTYPPLRCKACRDWLRGLEQEKRACTACRNVFMIGSGVLAHAKKYVGDPSAAGLYCPRCERLSSDERGRLVQKQATYAAYRAKHANLFKSKAALPVQFRVMDSLSGTKPFRNPRGLLEGLLGTTRALRGDRKYAGIASSPFRLVEVEGEESYGVTHLVPDTPAFEGKGIHFSGNFIPPSLPQALSVTDWKGTHETKHLNEFVPPETVAMFRANNESVLRNTNPERIIQLYQPHMELLSGRIIYEAIVKIDLQTQRCVVISPKEDRLRTAFPITVSPNDKRTSPSVTLQRIASKIQEGIWQTM